VFIGPLLNSLPGSMFVDWGAIPTFRLACEMRGEPELNAQQS
jgi:hypothetical protein